jgi:hypothetical protein
LCSAANDAIHWDGGAFKAAARTRGSASAATAASFARPFEASGGSASKNADGSWLVTPVGKTPVAFTGEETFLFAELQALSDLPSLASSESAAPELFFVTVSSLVGLSAAKRSAALPLVDAVLCDTLRRLAAAYGDALAAQVIFVDDFASADALEPRLVVARLLASPAPAPAGSLSAEAIASYQICLWTGVSLVLVLLSALCCMGYMDIQPDSLLYAKFQADLSSKNE